MTSHVRMVVVLGAVVALLGGCAATEVPTPMQTPSSSAPTSPGPTPSATPTPTPTTDPAADVPGACGELVPAAVIDEILGEGWAPTEERRDPQETFPGPNARAAAFAALETLSCQWYPSGTEGFLAMYAFRLDAAARDDLLEGLRTASSYKPIAIEGAEGFQTSETDEFWTVTTMYAFVDDVWIALHAPLYEVVASSLIETAVQGALSAAG